MPFEPSPLARTRRYTSSASSVPGRTRPHTSAFFQTEAQILDEVVDKEAGFIVQSEKADAQGVHGRTSCRAGSDQIPPFGDVETCFLCEQQGFAYAEHDAGNGYLIRQLGGLSRACFTTVQDLFSHDFEAGQYAFKCAVFSAHKDGKTGFARADIAACNGGVQSKFCSLPLLRQSWRARAGLEVVISHRIPLSQARQDSRGRPMVTSSTSAGYPTMEKTISLASPTSAGDAARTAPLSSSDRHLDVVRL